MVVTPAGFCQSVRVGDGLQTADEIRIIVFVVCLDAVQPQGGQLVDDFREIRADEGWVGSNGHAAGGMDEGDGFSRVEMFAADVGWTIIADPSIEGFSYGPHMSGLQEGAGDMRPADRCVTCDFEDTVKVDFDSEVS